MGNTRLRSILRALKYFFKGPLNKTRESINFNFTDIIFWRFLLLNIFMAAINYHLFECIRIFFGFQAPRDALMRFESVIMFFVVDEGNFMWCSGTSRWTKKLPRCSLHNVHLHKRRERKGTQKKSESKKNHRHSPFSTVHYIMLVLGIAFSINLYRNAHTSWGGWTRAQWVKI